MVNGWIYIELFSKMLSHSAGLIVSFLLWAERKVWMWLALCWATSELHLLWKAMHFGSPLWHFLWVTEWVTLLNRAANRHVIILSSVSSKRFLSDYPFQGWGLRLSHKGRGGTEQPEQTSRKNIPIHGQRLWVETEVVVNGQRLAQLCAFLLG